ncbi:major histocompatibility complex class I-related gene protein-like isoform X2 [Micropterus salmoides]|uniref:major histocompatibility complex class I-related gene protein-like isoform X2 n=1 Tax=Micropterus salmoides TaxID=27706 RepID=UPI0018ECD84F|nr:major histocompatibility complex class I-related gene protein-like isoform X2 [Micropterus salmoides]
MKTLFLLLLFCHISTAAKHSFNTFYTASSGVANFPEFVGVAVVDGIAAVSCDSNSKKIQPKQEWGKQTLENNPQQLEHYTWQCFERLPHHTKIELYDLKQRLNQSEGGHILQQMSGCEWDDATGELSGFMQFGYDGEDFLVFDLKTLTWIAPKQQAVATKLRWDTSAEIKYTVHYLTQMCLEWLKLFLTYGKSSLQRTDPPSVSLLQKTPSSPVICHATGFYPDRAVMFWRKDGEEIHEDVDHGEILPNHDGSFQMSVDLNVLSVTPEDWRRYDCVFQISGVKDNIITKMDKAVIRTNWEEPSVMTVPIVAAVVVLALVLIAAAGLMAYRKKKTKCTTIDPDNSSELSEGLNPHIDKHTK